MFKVPTSFNDINMLKTSHTPNSIKYDSEVYMYFVRSLYDRLFSRFEVELPENWNIDYFMFCLLMNGHIEVFRTKKYGIICQTGALHGIGLYYQPTRVNVVHGSLFQHNLKIGKDCEVIKISSDYMGIFDIIDFYAQKLSVLDSTINQSIVNTRLAYIFGAKNKAGSEMIKEAMERVQSGEPTVVINSENKDDVTLTDEPFSFVDFNVKNNYITDKLLNDYRNIYNQFDTEIGIPNVQTEKKERLIASEVESNNAETVTRFTTWCEQIELSVSKVKKLYPELKISIKPRVYETPNSGSKEAGKEVEVNDTN